LNPLAHAGPLNAIVDVEAAERAGWTAADLASAYVDGGARFLQVRAKSLSGAAFLELTVRICAIAHPAGAVVIVNDRVDIARIGGADGVHVGQDDLTPAAARMLLGPSALVGLSTHTEPQVDAAVSQPVSYVAVGPVFGTSTKATGYTAVGLDRVRYAAEKLRQAVRPKPDTTYGPPATVRLKPDTTYERDLHVDNAPVPEADATSGEGDRVGLVAIGGITLDRAADVIEAGATAVAVITDLMAGGDPSDRVRAYLARLRETGKV
jgi:thiamine-phosphate pyrophosphorylase